MLCVLGDLSHAQVVNEVRFGSVAALQAEIARLQTQLQQVSHLDDSHVSVQLMKELVSAHRSASEMYIQNAELWRQLHGLQTSILRLRCELRTQHDVCERLSRQGE